MNAHQKLVECLQMCLDNAEHEESPWMTEPAYVQHTFSDSDGKFVIERKYTYPSKLKPDEKLVKTLRKVLRPLLGQLLIPDTKWIGDGFEQIIGRSNTPYVHTLWSIAHMLISAAHRIGNVERVSKSFLELVHGGPITYQIRAILNGAHVVNEMQVIEGVTISPVHHSAQELNNIYLGLADMFPLVARGHCAMISIDCHAKPVYYRPEINVEQSKIEEFRPEITMPELFFNRSLEEFCESLSLAFNHPIEVCVKWYDFGDAQDFVEAGVRHEISTWSLRSPKLLEQDVWTKTVEIHRERFSKARNDNALALAVRRWIRSKIAQSDVDKLVELRIAMEALFGLNFHSEKTFRLSLYSAWYLGENRKQREDIFDTVKQFYGEASTAVHAGKPRVKDEKMIPKVQELCRVGILNCIKEADKPDWTKFFLGTDHENLPQS